MITTIFIINKMILAGHEVLYNYQLTHDDLYDHNIAIIQYDSRPLSSYWNTSFRWNKAYCDKYGHEYVFLSSHHHNPYHHHHYYHHHHHQICRYDNFNTSMSKDNKDDNNNHHQEVLLAYQWCKVKAMIIANDMIINRNSNVKAILFLDSDALITVNYSMAIVIGKVLYCDVL